ncbi:hypothetical protein [Lichenibacterium dinghuense]|uniref:hypothetical protein n=1 Tax=Lichenibacterium dinghuense TaxID=2895977 RepID=UPI001F3F363B|nr:hypothetical protein [Lichenibacterium sp. 6Y81]
MTADAPSRGRCPAFLDEPVSPPAAAAARSLAEQIEGIRRDLSAHRWLADRGDALAHGAALAAAHGVLVLATAPLASRADRDHRRTTLDGAVPALARAGLGHVGALVEAALALELHSATLERASGALQ